MIQKLLLVGGDRRAACMEELLVQEGFQVDTIGLHAGDEKTAQMDQADALLFPYPFAVRKDCVPTLTGLTLHPHDVLAKAKPDACILGGRGIETLREKRCWKSYGSWPWLEERNAEISAEAAVCEAMQRLGRMMDESRILVTGYGLFGRAVAKKLRLLGAEVWVAARRQEVCDQAEKDGMHAVALDGMENVLSHVHMVINTVPACILREKELCSMPKDSWMLELASAPYGFDREMAKKCGLRCEALPSLPSRYAPLSAAKALVKAVKALLEEVRE